MTKLYRLAVGFLLVLGFTTNSFANGLSLNSVGTKALGMGGAFVGLANDLTAIYWNPAGLAGQKTSLNAFFTGITPMGTYKTTGVDAEMVSNIYPTGGLLANYSMDNMSFGLGLYVPAGLGAEWESTDIYGPSVDGLDLLSKIGALSISPTFAYQVNDQFAVGLSINILYAMFDMKQPVPVPPNPVQFEEESSGLGFGATLGLLYAVNEQLQLGLTVRLASEVAMSGEAKNPLMAAFGAPTKSDFDRDVTWPMWIAGGVAYKVNEQLTITADAQWSQWSELEKLTATYDNAIWQGAMQQQGQDVLTLEWEDAIQIRLGGEYMVTPETAIRLGYYYDPAPAPDETVIILFPSATYHAGTLGFGHSFGQYRVDASMEYLVGEERDIDPATHNNPGKHQLDIFAFSIGFGMEL